MAVLVAVLVAVAAPAAQASIPPPESWPSLREEPAPSVLQPPSLEDLAVELAPSATSPTPDAAAAAGERFRLFEGLELDLATRSEPRFRLYPWLETRVWAITLPEPLHVELELPLTPSRFRLYGDPGPRIAVGGTFISPDPTGYVDGANLYQFAGNDPVNYDDPLGLQTDPEKLKVPPGLLMQTYLQGVEEANNENYTLLTRIGYAAQSVAYALPAGLEEYGRGVTNIPYAFTKNTVDASSIYAEAAVTQDKLEKTKLISQGTGKLCAAFCEAGTAAVPASSTAKSPVVRLLGKIWARATGRAAAPAEKALVETVDSTTNVSGGLADDMIVVRGGTKPIPPPGETFSGAYGKTIEEAASGVPHNQVRATTAGEINAGGGTVEVAPEMTRAGTLNDRHVNICLGEGPCPFGPLEPNPVPKAQRVQ